MGSPATAGAVTTGIGTAANAYGQRQGIDAMDRVWRNEQGAQRGFDAALQGRTNDLIAGINPQTLMNPQGKTELVAKSDTVARNTAGAVGKANARKKGRNPEGEARVNQNLQSVLARVLGDGRVQAALQALTSGQNKVDLLGRQFNQDANVIRGDARRHASTLPQRQDAAGMTGGAARQIGTLFNNLGQGAMSYGMAQPPAPPPATAVGDFRRRPLVDPLTGHAQV